MSIELNDVINEVLSCEELNRILPHGYCRKVLYDKLIDKFETAYISIHDNMTDYRRMPLDEIDKYNEYKASREMGELLIKNAKKEIYENNFERRTTFKIIFLKGKK